jgi:hypothetical protein
VQLDPKEVYEFQSSWNHKWVQELLQHFEHGGFCICDSAVELAYGFGCTCTGTFVSWRIRIKDFKVFHPSVRYAYEDLRKKTVSVNPSSPDIVGYINTKGINKIKFGSSSKVVFGDNCANPDPDHILNKMINIGMLQKEIDKIGLKLRKPMSPVRRKKLREKRAYLEKRLNTKN